MVSEGTLPSDGGLEGIRLGQIEVDAAPLVRHGIHLPPLLVPFLLPLNDDHEVHIALHEEILLDDSKPWPIRQLVALHVHEHQAMLQLQAQALADAEKEIAATEAA